MKLCRSIGAALCALLSVAIVPQAVAALDDYPSHAVRVLVGFAAGGSADTVMRILAPRMSALLKQSVVVENRPGAGGNIATELLVNAPADGYTIMLGTIGSLAVNQHLNKLGYDPVTQTTALSMALQTSNILLVNEASAIRSLDDYIRLARNKQSNLSFGSSGIGSSGYLAGELLKSIAGLQNQHVAYRGGAPAMNDLLGGSLPVVFTSPTDSLQFIQAGKLRPLAVTGSKRLEALPQVPTVAESGYPGFEVTNWYAFVAPQGTPTEIVQRLNAAIVASLSDPPVVAKLHGLELDPLPTTPDEAGRFIRSESEKWGAVLSKAGITIH